MPFYENAATLELAIRSVFAQTFEDWELWLADDGSSDGSRALVEGIRDPRIHVVRSDQNLGQGSQRNRLAKLARGELLAVMDADDVMVPGRLAAQVAALDADPSLHLVASAVYLLSAAGEPFGLAHQEPLDRRGFRAIRAGWIIHPSVMARREWLLANPYDERLRRGQDHELWARTYPQLVAGRLSEPLQFYRVGGKGTLASHLRGWRASMGVYLKYGPEKVGWMATMALVLGTLGLWLRGTMWNLLGAEVGSFLRSQQRLTGPGLEAADQALAEVGAAAVPGWDETR